MSTIWCQQQKHGSGFSTQGVEMKEEEEEEEARTGSALADRKDAALARSPRRS